MRCLHCVGEKGEWRQQNKKTVEYVELIIYTEDMAPPVPLALAAIPALPGHSFSPGPLSLSASPATSLSPWLSLYNDTETITNDIYIMDNTKLFQHYENSLPPEVTSDVVD